MNTSFPKHAVSAMGPLPIPNKLLARALRLVADSPDNGSALAALLLSYPATAVRVFQGINLSQLGRAPADSLLRAVEPCHVYGVLLRALPLQSPSEERESFLEAFWKNSYATALVAERLAGLTRRTAPALASLAGLFHDAGRLVFWTLNGQAWPNGEEGTVPAPELSLLGKWFVESAGLPQSVQDAVWLHHAPPEALDAEAFPLELIRLTAFAAQFAHTMTSEEPAPDLVRQCAAFLAADPAQLDAQLADARSEYLRTFQVQGDGETNALECEELSTALQSLYAAIDRELRRVPALSSQLGRMEALHRAVSALAGREPLEALVNSCAEIVRTALHVAPGVCLAIDEAGGCLVGCSWRSVDAALAPLHVKLNGGDELDEDDAPVTRIVRDLALSKIEASWYPHDREVDRSRDGLLVLPLACEGKSHGQIIVDTSRSGFGARAHDRADALAIAQAFAAILAQRSHMDQLTTRLEHLIECTAAPAKPSAPAAPEKNEPHHAPSQAPAADESLGRVAGSIVKALEGPIGLISSQAQRLLIRTKDIETHRALDCIVKESRRLNRFMSDLHALAPHPHPQFETSLINYRLQRFVGAMRQRLEKRGVVVHEQYAEGLPRVLIDPRRMEHVFSNVLTHAEACIGEEGGDLTIQTSSTPDRADVQVRFTYAGAALARSPGRGAEAPHHMNEPAVGLGACRAIMREHGGSIAIETLPGGQEACTIVLHNPVTPREEAVVRDRFPSGAGNPGAARILVVDDDVAVRELLKQTLQMRGYAVDLASDGVQAWTTIRRSPPDIILLDLLMPNRDGLSVLRDLRQLTDPPPVIFMTGNASPQIRDEALSLGAHCFLLKPFELRRILEEVDGVLAHHG